MDRRHLTIGLLFVLVVAFGTFVAAGGATGGYAVVIADHETGEILHAEHATEGTTIELEYTHSVEKTPIVEVYEIDEGTLINTEIHFSSYGAGLPSNADVEREGGSFVSTPNTTHDDLHVSPGEIAGHTVTIDGSTYDLVAMSDGRTVTIRAEPYWRGMPDRLVRSWSR